MERKLGCILSEVKPWAVKYPFGLLGLGESPAGEVELPFPYQMRAKMAQKRKSCTAWALAWITMINNLPRPVRERNPRTFQFDAEWMYDEGRLIDGWPDNDRINDPDCDLGTFIWAVMAVLMNQGHRQISRGKSLAPDLKWRIKNFYWCQTIGEMEAAIAIGRSIEFGFPIPNNLLDLKEKHGELWIGEEENWGPVIGGHALCGRRYSRSREGFQVIHTYGLDYPLQTWISYRSVERLMQMAGEACVGIDDKTVGG